MNEGTELSAAEVYALRRSLNSGRRFTGDIEKELKAGNYASFLDWLQSSGSAVDWEGLSISSEAKSALKAGWKASGGGVGGGGVGFKRRSWTALELLRLRRAVGNRYWGREIDAELRAGSYESFFGWLQSSNIQIDWDALNINAGAKAEFKVLPSGPSIRAANWLT